MKSELEKLIEKWEQEKGSYIPNAPIYQCFIDEAKEVLEKEKNKWIKIESEKDLPKEKGLYWVFCRGEVQTKSFLKSYYDIHLWIDNVRYYQPIQKPEPPLF